MQEFVVLNTSVPLTTEEEQELYRRSGAQDYCHPGDEPREVKAVRATLKADSRRLLFAYSRVDYVWVYTSADQETTLEMFVQGDDQREHDTLMGIVAANRANCGLPVVYSSPSKFARLWNPKCSSC